MSNRGNSIRDRISDDYEKTEGYLLFDVTEAVGLEMDEFDRELEIARDNFDADNLEGEILTKYCYQRKGIQRKPAVSAKGIVTVSGTGTVEQGDLFETENGVQFEAAETVEVTDSGDVNVIAVIPGNNGIVGANTITDMPVTIAGISACNNDQPTHGGYDEETDDSLRNRFYEAVRNPSGNGNRASYKAWAKQVTGVGDAKVFPLAKGVGTVDVVIINSEMKPADAELVKSTQDYIDPDSTGEGNGQAPIGARCYASSATGKDVNVSVTVSAKSTATKESVKLEVKNAVINYLKNIAFVANKVSLAQVGNAILEVPDVVDYENLKLNGSMSSVSVGDREVAILERMDIVWA